MCEWEQVRPGPSPCGMCRLVGEIGSKKVNKQVTHFHRCVRAGFCWGGVEHLDFT